MTKLRFPVLAAVLLASLGLAGGASAATGAGTAAAAGPCISVTGLQPPTPATGQTGFRGVSMRNGCDAWAVGTTIATSGDTALIEHFDGSGWSVTGNPDVAGIKNTGLRAVAAIAADNAWAVGTAGQASLIEHWDGTGWHKVSNPADEPAGSSLAAIWAVSPTSIWAVGNTSNGTAGTDKTLIEHYDGSRWTVSQNVPSPGSSAALQGVTATSAADVWAVGNGPGGGVLVLHWNGSAWAVSPAPTLFGVLTGVAATTPGNAWAVGYVGQGFGFVPVVLHWNGRDWTSSTGLPAGGSRLLAIATTSDTPGTNRNIWAVGDDSNGFPLAWRFDGSSWVAVPAPAFGTVSRFTTVSASSASSVWLAGNSSAAGVQTPIAVSCC
jgi:hypothetical protein